MTALPWDKFYWSDYSGDPALKLCSLAAQGLWMRMLCICALSEPKGYLTVEGQSLTTEDMVSLFGKGAEVISPLIEELRNKNVFSTDRTGKIYNRKMVRNAKKAKTARQNLKKPHHVSHSHDSEITPLGPNDDTETDDDLDQNTPPNAPGSNQSLEARSQKLDKKESLPSGDVPTDPGGSMILVEGEAEAVVEAEGATLPVLVIEATSLPVVRLNSSQEIEAAELWNDMARRTGLPQVQKFTSSRKVALRKRLEDCQGLPGWKVALAKIEASAFLCGQHSSSNHPNWRADFDFITREKVFVKLMEGGYDGTRGPNHADQLDEAFRKIAGEADGYSGFSLTAR